MKLFVSSHLWRRLAIVLGVMLLGLVVLRLSVFPRTLPLAVHTIHADDAMLQQVKALGATYVVQVFSWSDIQPSRERWEWEYSDWLVRAADYYHLQVIARLDKPPAWAVNNSSALSAPPRDIDEYAEFVRRVTERYKGKIPAYIVWNEPNLATEWGNQPPDPAAYAALLQRASQTIRATDPQAQVIAAGLSPTNENSANAMDDRTFLRGVYAAGAGSAFDVLAAHPYAFALPPAAPAGSNDELNFARIQQWRDIMNANGDGSKPIWITEFGYPTEQPAGFEGRAVSEAQQAQYLTAAYGLARDQLPWVQLFTAWNITRDVPATDEQYGYSLMRADGTPKPAFDALAQVQTRSLLVRLTAQLRASLVPTLPATTYPVLAQDMMIHLGDSEYTTPFVPLYRGVDPAVSWKGVFYLTDADLSGTRGTQPWTLYVELMQVNDFDSRIWINDVPVTPAFLPVEDFTSKWVTAQFQVPADALRAGDNFVAIQDGKLVPALQQADFTWDEVQFRNVRLVPQP